MNTVRRKVLDFVCSEDGPTAVEYAVMLALILGGIIATMASFGQQVNDLYDTINGTAFGT